MEDAHEELESVDRKANATADGTASNQDIITYITTGFLSGTGLNSGCEKLHGMGHTVINASNYMKVQTVLFSLNFSALSRVSCALAVDQHLRIATMARLASRSICNAVRRAMEVDQVS